MVAFALGGLLKAVILNLLIPLKEPLMSPRLRHLMLIQIALLLLLLNNSLNHNREPSLLTLLHLNRRLSHRRFNTIRFAHLRFIVLAGGGVSASEGAFAGGWGFLVGVGLTVVLRFWGLVLLELLLGYFFGVGLWGFLFGVFGFVGVLLLGLLFCSGFF